ncbi:MAG: hypothetical protein CL920_29030 [Deltaproteobacteria bacterium]|nr:hypothetical protein [Deltaproteobacteria bacterium]
MKPQLSLWSLLVVCYVFVPSKSEASTTTCAALSNQKQYLRSAECFRALAKKMKRGQTLSKFKQVRKGRYLRNGAWAYQKSAQRTNNSSAQAYRLEQAIFLLQSYIDEDLCGKAYRCKRIQKQIKTLRKRIKYIRMRIVTRRGMRARVTVKGYRYTRIFYSPPIKTRLVRPGRYSIFVKYRGLPTVTKRLALYKRRQNRTVSISFPPPIRRRRARPKRRVKPAKRPNTSAPPKKRTVRLARVKKRPNPPKKETAPPTRKNKPVAANTTPTPPPRTPPTQTKTTKAANTPKPNPPTKTTQVASKQPPPRDTTKTTDSTKPAKITAKTADSTKVITKKADSTKVTVKKADSTKATTKTPTKTAAKTKTLTKRVVQPTKRAVDKKENQPTKARQKPTKTRKTKLALKPPTKKPAQATPQPFPVAPVILGGVGGLLLAGGVVLTVFGQQAQDQVLSNIEDIRTRSITNTIEGRLQQIEQGESAAAVQQTFRDTQNLQTAGWVLIGSGVVAVGVGVTLFILSRPKPQPTSLTPSPLSSTQSTRHILHKQGL